MMDLSNGQTILCLCRLIMDGLDVTISFQEGDFVGIDDFRIGLWDGKS